MQRRLALWVLIAVSLTSFACKKAKPTPKATPDKVYPASELTIYVTDRFRSSGLEGTIIPDFSKKFNCKINLVLRGDTADLASSLNVPDSVGVDLVLGLTNSFAVSDSLLDWFEPYALNSATSLARDAKFDGSNRLIPYGYSYLSLVYDTRQLSSPPTSFGSMQDATYISQMAICDPNRSGLGRATLL
ncbi:MAG TPA: thiamine ABC transporter substrate-binding protein, partial [Candidatus Cloacimonadota bacterium]|nr:thiamine ABC transporter substrate-binding protein [Candidatus Cloacimonadota bacterium]